MKNCYAPVPATRLLEAAGLLFPPPRPMPHTVSTKIHDKTFSSAQGCPVFAPRQQSIRRPKRPGPIARWKEKRRAEKQRLAEEKAAEAELQLDALLDKVHAHGIDSLSEAERRQLHRASARYRDKGGKPQ